MAEMSSVKARNGLELIPQGQVPRSLPYVIPSMASTSRPVLDSVRIPRTGLQLPYRLPFDAWVDMGKRLAAVVNSSAWCLGDWLVYGEVNFTGRYREAIERTSLDYQTLRNYAWVARKFSLQRRRENLSFGHHAEVAALPEPEQDYWLRKAEELGWSRNQTRHEIRTSLRERNAAGTAQEDQAEEPPETPDATQAAEAPVLTIRMELTRDQLEQYQNAADRAECSIEDWAMQILDRAALATSLLKAVRPRPRLPP